MMMNATSFIQHKGAKTMTEKQEDYRTKAERIAYLRAEITRLEELHREPWKQEMLSCCVAALNERVEMILEGKV